LNLEPKVLKISPKFVCLNSAFHPVSYLKQKHACLDLNLRFFQSFQQIIKQQQKSANPFGFVTSFLFLLHLFLWA
jgi:hypothetical protein